MTENLFPPDGSEARPADGAAAPTSEERVYRIGEVCRLTGTKAFVLRYWETEFPMLAPDKSPKGHRLYRREDVDMVFEIKRLLYEQGFTIAGARRHLESRGSAEGASEPATSAASAAPALPPGSSAARKLLVDLGEELRAILTLLENG
jgi:DNA-binding transcriptional MerR regulator